MRKVMKYSPIFNIITDEIVKFPDFYRCTALSFCSRGTCPCACLSYRFVFVEFGGMLEEVLLQ